MKSMDNTDIGAQYEELSLLLSQLNTDAPKIQKLYSELRSNAELQSKHILQTTIKMDELSKTTMQAIQKERDSAIELFKQYSTAAEQALSEAKDLKKHLDSFSSLVESTNRMMESIEHRLDRIEENLESRQLALLSQQPVMKAKSTSTKRIEVDYDEVTTAKNLYDKYYGKIEGPLIIQRANWFGDYAFVVDELFKNETWVRGAAYADGEFRRNASYHADTEEFKMYSGPSANKIKAIYESAGNSSTQDSTRGEATNTPVDELSAIADSLVQKYNAQKQKANYVEVVRELLKMGYSKDQCMEIIKAQMVKNQ